MVEEFSQDLTIVEQRGSNIIEVDPSKIAQNLVAMVTKADIMTPEDKKFFIDNSERWNYIQQNCYNWRTDVEQDSILSELPTTHLKFHQAILENRVFVDETVRLAKDAEMLKLDAEELYLDIESIRQDILELENERRICISIRKIRIDYEIKKKDLEIRKKTVELQEKAYQIQQSAIAMKYRMRENRLWKEKEDILMDKLRQEGYTEEQIADKNFGQREGYFFLFLTKYLASTQSKDTGERHNASYLAKYAVDEAIKKGDFENFVKRCDNNQLESLVQLGYIAVRQNENGLSLLIPEQFKKTP